MNKNLENHAKNRGFSDKTQEKRRIREILLRREAENWRNLAFYEELKPWVPRFLDFFQENRAFFLCVSKTFSKNFKFFASTKNSR